VFGEFANVIVTSIFDTSNALFDAARNLFQSTAQNDASAPHALLLPGGNTPRPLFQNIREYPFPVDANFRIGYTDERYVPEKNPLNNFTVSKDMIHALGISDSQIMRVNTDMSLDAAAEDYNSTLREFFEDGGIIPLAFLGLGVDGHTCSLFTKEDIRACSEDRFAVPVRREEKPDRISVTPALLQRIRHIVILTTGPEKAAIVDAMTHEPDHVVAGKVLAECARVSLWYAPQD